VTAKKEMREKIRYRAERPEVYRGRVLTPLFVFEKDRVVARVEADVSGRVRVVRRRRGGRS
jgi:hypothetical protein